MENINNSISFLHPESNKEITITTDKKFIIIYGKNGSGKTSLSRSDIFDENLVFNSDFVNKNIFITEEDGIKMSPGNRKNFSEIWIGEDIVSIVNERELFEKAQRENKIELDKITEVIINELNLNDIPKIMEGITLKEKDFSFVIEDISNHSDSFKTQQSLPTNIENENELKKDVLILKNNLILDQFTSTISENMLLNELINKKTDRNIIYNLNKKIDIMKSNNDEILAIDNILKSRNIDEKTEKYIKDWYDYHKDKDICIFCGNEDIEQSLQEWKYVFENEIKEIKIDVIKELTRINDSLIPIIQNKQFQEISPETSKFILDVKNIINEVITLIKENEYSQIIIEDFEIPKIISDIELIKLNIHNYIFNKNINKVAFLQNNSSSLKEELTNIKRNLDSAMELNADKYEKGINETLKKVGLDKDISLEVNRRGTSMTYQVNMSNNNDIKTLSNGQQHRLALALFLYSLKEKEYKDKTIVIDDPVVTLDALGYHQVKRYLVTDLISTFKENGDVRLLILTHDFNYLTVQVHDILDNDKKHLKDITGIFKINHDKLSEFDIELLFKDDISLFKLILKRIDSIESLRLIPNLSLKIFRHFVDLKQRIQGVPQVTGINIETLLIDDDTKKKCSDYQSNNISKFKGKNFSDIDILEVYEDLVSLQEVLKLLGFPEVIENSQLEKIRDILNNGVSKDLLDPIFDIISAINNFLLINTDTDIRNYIMHPRVSFTSNLISMALDEEFGQMD